ncbi:3-hydroxyacyl-CoA dehydrogenase NAD-binding domain-containing protein [Nonomuraea sp. GTA35]|uniref:3-hydroxyacyl-CoA dehydrogenase NAD-binding domain-containing protein n=1 Tax=Nonomuraea sp. GTA35 TaxID=1676746 RepID=UPI0035C10F95
MTAGQEIRERQAAVRASVPCVARAREERAVGDQTVLAGDTGSLSIAELGAALQRPAWFLRRHFFNPAPRISAGRRRHRTRDGCRRGGARLYLGSRPGPSRCRRAGLTGASPPAVLLVCWPKAPWASPSTAVDLSEYQRPGPPGSDCSSGVQVRVSLVVHGQDFENPGSGEACPDGSGPLL